MNWNFSPDRPIYTQLTEQLKLALISGEFQPGEWLPPVRELASVAGVNPNTMQRALVELEREGLLCAKSTNGRIVTEDRTILSHMRTNLAKEVVAQYLSQTQALGYTREEALELVRRYGAPPPPPRLPEPTIP